MVAGPAIGGLLVAALGFPVAYLVDALTFAVNMVFLLRIAPIPPLAAPVRRGVSAVLEGLDFVRRRRVLATNFLVDLAMIFAMPRALFPVFALDVYGIGAAGVGLFASALALGALCGALLTGWIPRVQRPGRAVLLAGTIWGLAIGGFGLATLSFPLALLAVAGAADVVSAVFRTSLLQLATPDALRSRLLGLHILVVQAGPRLGDFRAGLVASLSTPQISVVSGAIMCVVGLAMLAFASPAFIRSTIGSAELDNDVGSSPAEARPPGARARVP